MYHMCILLYLYIVLHRYRGGRGVWLKNRYGSFRGYKRFDLDLLRRYLKLPGKSTTFHSRVWIKGIDQIPWRCMIMGMDRGLSFWAPATYVYVTSKSAHNRSDITISHGFPTNLKIPPKHCFGRFVYSVFLAFMCSQKFDSDPLTLTVGFPRPGSKASKLRPGATEDTSCDETHVGHWNLTWSQIKT